MRQASNHHVQPGTMPKQAHAAPDRQARSVLSTPARRTGIHLPPTIQLGGMLQHVVIHVVDDRHVLFRRVTGWAWRRLAGLFQRAITLRQSLIHTKARYQLVRKRLVQSVYTYAWDAAPLATTVPSRTWP